MDRTEISVGGEGSKSGRARQIACAAYEDGDILGVYIGPVETVAGNNLYSMNFWDLPTWFRNEYALEPVRVR